MQIIMESIMEGLIISLAITAIAYMALPIIFAAIFPEPLSKKACKVIAVIYSVIVYFVFLFLGGGVSATRDVLPAIIWTTLAIWLMEKTTNKKTKKQTSKQEHENHV